MVSANRKGASADSGKGVHMGPEVYFVQDPWEKTAENVRNGVVGRIVAVGIQESCEPGTLIETRERWLSRLEVLIGKPESTDIIDNGPVSSTLVRYHGPALARIFLEEGSGSSVSNFEITGLKALLVWKPDDRPFSVIKTQETTLSLFKHAYPAELARG